MGLSEDGIQQSKRQRDNRTDDGARSQTAAAEQQHGAQSGAADGGKDDCLRDLHRYVFLFVWTGDLFPPFAHKRIINAVL